MTSPEIQLDEMSEAEMRSAINNLIGAVAQMYLVVYAIGGDDVKPLLDSYVERVGVRILIDESEAETIRELFEEP